MRMTFSEMIMEFYSLIYPDDAEYFWQVFMENISHEIKSMDSESRMEYLDTIYHDIEKKISMIKELAIIKMEHLNNLYLKLEYLKSKRIDITETENLFAHFHKIRKIESSIKIIENPEDISETRLNVLKRRLYLPI